MIYAWLLLCFSLCLVCDWLGVKHYYASNAGHAWAAAGLSGAWTCASAAGLVIAVKVSLWLLAADVLGHAAGSYIGVKWRKQ